MQYDSFTFKSECLNFQTSAYRTMGTNSYGAPIALLSTTHILPGTCCELYKQCSFCIRVKVLLTDLCNYHGLIFLMVDFTVVIITDLCSKYVRPFLFCSSSSVLCGLDFNHENMKPHKNPSKSQNLYLVYK